MICFFLNKQKYINKNISDIRTYIYDKKKFKEQNPFGFERYLVHVLKFICVELVLYTLPMITWVILSWMTTTKKNGKGTDWPADQCIKYLSWLKSEKLVINLRHFPETPLDFTCHLTSNWKQQRVQESRWNGLIL